MDEEKINAFLSRFEAFSVSFVIEDVEDFSQYGLDDPTCTITLGTEDETYEILLGSYSTMDEERYVSIGDGKVYLVPDDPLEDYDAPLSEMIRNDEIPAFEEVEAISFEGDTAYDIYYEENSPNTYCEEDVYFTELESGILPLDTSRVSTYLSTVSGLNLGTYVTYNATEEEIASCGLDDPNLTVTVTCEAPVEDIEETETAAEEDGGETATETEEAAEETEETATETRTFTLHVGRSQEEVDAALEEAEEGAEEEALAEVPAYVRIDDSPILYEITSEEYDALMAASCDSLRHQEIFSGSFEQIRQLDIALEGEAYTITCEVTEDEESEEGELLYTYFYGEEEIDATALQSALTALEASSFTDETPGDTEEIRLTLSLDNESIPEVELAFYRYDGSDCLAVVDGAPVALVPRYQVVDLIEAIHAIVLDG